MTEHQLDLWLSRAPDAPHKSTAFAPAIRGISGGLLSCRGMFDKEVISKMKKGAFLVNNARGAIVDQDAVEEALKSGQLGGAYATPFAL